MKNISKRIFFDKKTKYIVQIFSKFFIIFFFTSIVLYSQGILFPDSDGDGITDKLELFAGLNPNEDECQPRKCRGISIQGSINGEYIIVILGQNLSMQEKEFEGISKLDSIKLLYKDFIQYSPNYVRMGTYTYGKNGCSALDEVQSAFKNGSKSGLIKEIEILQPSGKSAISESLDKLRDELKGKKGKFNILVILDDIDTCGGNLETSVKKLTAMNNFRTGVKVFFAGIKLAKPKAEVFEKLSTDNSVKYMPIENSTDLKKIFDPPIKEIINSLRGMVCLQVELDDLIKCESNKINQLKRISIKKLNNPIDKDFSAEEKDYFLQQIPVVELNSKIKLEAYDLYKKDSSNNYQKRIIELSKIVNTETR